MKDKIVLITGSSRGIGRHAAYKFAEREANLVITYNNSKEEAEETVERCKELGASKILLLKLDVTETESIKDVVRKTTDEFGRIDILINNAGVAVWKHLDEQNIDEIENQLRTNLEGLIKMTKYALPHTEDVIINIASGAGKQGFSDLTTYCATKFGVRGFTQALSKEINIDIFSVNPGVTSTRMTDYSGVPPEKVAEVIFNTAVRKYNISSGGDIDVWEKI